LGLTIIVLVGLAFGGYRISLKYRWFVWPLLVLHLATFEYTGSRGGYLALLSGFVVFSLSGGGSLFKSRALIVAPLVVALCAGISYRSGNMWARLERAYQGEDMSGRERIYPEAWQMVLERPLLGYGPADNLYELESRLQDNHEYRDTHNLLLEQ